MIIWQAIAILLLFTVVVGVHELGHYLFARWRGMDVEEFAIGFGKRLATRQDRNGTFWSLRAVPLGGFVKIKGMEPKADASETRIERGFYSRGLGSRALVLAAGPLFSILFGVIFFFTELSIFGDPRPAPVVLDVDEEGPAATAGFLPGDRILVIDGVAVDNFYTMQTTVGAAPGRELEVTIDRKGRQMQVTVIPEVREILRYGPDGMPEMDSRGEPVVAPLGALGIVPGRETVRVSVPEAARLSVLRSWMIITLTGKVLMNPQRLSKEAGGPITIGRVTAEAAAEGVNLLIRIAAIISLSLGLINLLPIPPMDGGQLMIVLAETFRGGRRLSLKAQEMAMTVGFTIVMLLIISVLFLDVRRLFG